MDRLIKLKKGLDLKLVGESSLTTTVLKSKGDVAVQPTDFYGMTPRVVVKEGEHVLAGQAVFTDKATGRVNLVSPVSGTVKAVVRGERRKLLRAVITPDEQQQARDFGQFDYTKMEREAIVGTLLQSGLFAFFRQRPYDVVASPDDNPKGIFVSAFSKMPLAANFSYVVKGQENAFQKGIKVLSRIAPTHVGICLDQVNTPILPIEEADVNIFDGPNPSGNVGVQINHIDPINKGEVVWTLGAEEVIFIGRLFETGRIDFTRKIAVAGSCVTTPSYVETVCGMSVKNILQGLLKDSNDIRIIDGNPLVGNKTDLDGFLGAHTTEICALPEGADTHELLGWISPGLKDFSANRSYFSWLGGKNKAYDLDCRIKGGERHIIMSGEYDRVFPMDIFAGYLVKAIITGDIDRQEALGIYEVAPEDFAVAEFVDSSKLELQRIVREGLDILRKENA